MINHDTDSINRQLGGRSLTLHSQHSPSNPNGDLIASDYQITLPQVTSGTYAANLQYIAMTN